LKNIQIFKFTSPAAKKEEKAGVLFAPPSAPKGLKLLYSDGKITVSWDKNTEPDMDHYIIYRKDSKADQLIEIASVKENLYPDKDIKEGLTFTYGVKAVDAEKLSSQMSELQAIAAEIIGITKKARAAVFTFKEASEKAKAGGFGDAIAEFLTTSLVNLAYFDVVEREQLKRIIEEQSLSHTGALESAQKLGEIMGIDVFIMGSVTLLGELVEIDSRLVDVSTGRVITAQNVSAEGLPRVREAVKDMSNKIVTNYHLQLGSIWGAVRPHDTDIGIILESGGKLYTGTKADKKSGRFSFSGVLSGTYQLKVLTDKYDAVNLPHAVLIKSGERTEIPEIELRIKEIVQKPILPEIKIPALPPSPPPPAGEKIVAPAAPVPPIPVKAAPSVPVETKPPSPPAEEKAVPKPVLPAEEKPAAPPLSVETKPQAPPTEALPKISSPEPEPQKAVTPSEPVVTEEKKPVAAQAETVEVEKPETKEGTEVIDTPESPQ
jgi:TolB-like protein